ASTHRFARRRRDGMPAQGADPSTRSPNGSRQAPPLLEFDSVSKTFPDGTVALDDVFLRTNTGEFVAVVGPSGCRKATLLQIAAGLVPATSGEVNVDQSDLGYVFQSPTLLPWRAGIANIELPAKRHGMCKGDRRARAPAAISLVGLTGFEAHLPRTLSG